MNTNDEQYVESSLLRDRDGKLQDYSSKNTTHFPCLSTQSIGLLYNSDLLNN